MVYQTWDRGCVMTLTWLERMSVGWLEMTELVFYDTIKYIFKKWFIDWALRNAKKQKDVSPILFNSCNSTPMPKIGPSSHLITELYHEVSTLHYRGKKHKEKERPKKIQSSITSSEICKIFWILLGNISSQCDSSKQTQSISDCLK